MGYKRKAPMTRCLVKYLCLYRLRVLVLRPGRCAGALRAYQLRRGRTVPVGFAHCSRQQNLGSTAKSDVGEGRTVIRTEVTRRATVVGSATEENAPTGANTSLTYRVIIYSAVLVATFASRRGTARYFSQWRVTCPG